MIYFNREARITRTVVLNEVYYKIEKRKWLGGWDFVNYATTFDDALKAATNYLKPPPSTDVVVWQGIC